MTCRSTRGGRRCTLKSGHAGHHRNDHDQIGWFNREERPQGEAYREQGTTYVRLGRARLARLRRAAVQRRKAAGKPPHGALQEALRQAVDLWLTSARS